MDYTRDLESHACTSLFLSGIYCCGKQSAVGSHRLNYKSNVYCTTLMKSITKQFHYKVKIWTKIFCTIAFLDKSGLYLVLCFVSALTCPLGNNVHWVRFTFLPCDVNTSPKQFYICRKSLRLCIISKTQGEVAVD